jgi:hypothetical protein
MRVLLVVVLVGCAPSAITATCAPDDVDCWASHLTFVDAAGNTTSAVLVDSASVAAISTQTSAGSAAPGLFTGPATFDFPNGTVVSGTTVLLTANVDVAFSDPNGCSPVLGFRLSTRAGVHAKNTGCFPGVHDMKRSGAIMASFGFSATATAPAGLSVDLVPISSTDCTSIDDPTALIKLSTAVAGVFAPVALTIAPPPSSGSGGTCDGLLASTLECDPLGRGGVASTCITSAEYMQATGMPLPAACTASGGTGCENSSGTLVKPCCPGLTCEVGAACGDAGNATGGTCR